MGYENPICTLGDYSRPSHEGNIKFLAIAVKHSTKWVEAKHVTTANEKQAEKFVWEHIIRRFGVPKAITSKDDKQFREGIFADLCSGLKVRSLIPSATSLIPVSKGHGSKDKRKEAEGREVASIEEAYYQNKLQRYYDARRPHIITGVYEGQLYKITYASDYSLVQSAKGISLHIDYFNDFENQFLSIVYNDALTSEPEVSSDFENEFSAIMYNDALTSEAEVSSEPMTVYTAYSNPMDMAY
ncbi:reverse transcriptase domain-containing protein [Tanacetum coccineum]